MDPAHIAGFLSDSVLVAAIGGLAAWAGSSANSRASKEQARITLLDVTVKSLSSRVAALEAAVAAAEQRRDEAERAERAAVTKQWHVVDYAMHLLSWGRQTARRVEDAPGEPPVPSEIKDLF